MQVLQRHIALLVHLDSTGAVAELVTSVLEDTENPLSGEDQASTDELIAELKDERKEDLQEAVNQKATTLCPCQKLIGLLLTDPHDVSCLSDCTIASCNICCTSLPSMTVTCRAVAQHLMLSCRVAVGGCYCTYVDQFCHCCHPAVMVTCSNSATLCHTCLPHPQCCSHSPKIFSCCAVMH